MPPLAVVAWIYALGRRERRGDPDRPTEEVDDDLEDDDAAVSPTGERGAGH